MLAYVFWHRPRPEIVVAEYEEAQRVFLAALGAAATSFRLDELPFDGGPGYEDWYLVEDWSSLGELNASAIDALRRTSHDHLAAMSADGWGSIYGLAKGPVAIPDGAEWLEKPRGESSEEFIASLSHETIWRRQLVLGPAPEFCGAAAQSAGRTRVSPGA